jgi:carbonic anhydrase
MWKLLSLSTVVKAGVADGQLEVVGGIYHGDGDVEKPPGQIEWLGGHPSQESAVSKMASLYPPSGVLSAQDVVEQKLPSPTSRGTVNQLLEDYLAGNTRFLHRDGQARSDWTAHKLATLQSTSSAPKTLVLSCANRLDRAPERLLDVRPGELLVHRTCGSIGGRSEGCSVRFLEDLLNKHAQIPLLLVLGDSCDPAISLAISQVKSKAKALKHPNAQMALEQITPAVVHALAAMDGESEFNDHEQQPELAELTAELQIRYVLERLLIDSDLVIDRVAMGTLEVQGAVVQADGSLRMLGGPDVHRLIGQKARVERHRRKGVGLGRFRTKGRQFVYNPRA